jgi:hypothetical protein
MDVLNQEIEWIFQNLVSNQTYNNLWVKYEGKPLLIPFDGGDVHNKEKVPFLSIYTV